MKFEGYTAKQEPEVAIDHELFDRLQEYQMSALADVAIERKVLATQKEKFLSGEVNCPHFTYEKVRTKEYAAIEDGLLALKDSIKNDDSVQEVVSQTYRWAINERIARVRMLRELQRLEQGGDPTYHMRRFMHYAQFIYGMPQEDIYEGITHALYEKLSAVPEEIQKAAPEAYANLQHFAHAPKLPLSELVPESKAAEPAEEVRDIESMKAYFEDAIEQMGLSSEWKIEVDTDSTRSNLSVSLAQKKVFLPSQEWLDSHPKQRSMTTERIRGLIVHEIGTHALRNYNGARSRLLLLSTGLDRYEVGEEGLATYREQQEREKGATDFARFDYYFAACLASGIDGNGKRDFAGVFEIMRDYYQVCERMSEEEAKEAAWKRCVRTFRGTPGDIPGAFFPKDMIYRKGNIATYSLLQKEGSERIDFNIGKFDPSNPRHLSILIELGILDSDLEQLAQELA